MSKTKADKTEESKTQKEFKDLCFTDDIIFNEVMKNNVDIAKEMLEVILNKTITKITYIESQKEYQIMPGARGTRFDIYVEDDKNVIYDIEMQIALDKNIGKRIRVYQGRMDLDAIHKGQKYNELRKSYIIFICMYNPFDLFMMKINHPKTLVKYTFDMTCREIEELRQTDDKVPNDAVLRLDTGANVIFVNPFGDKSNCTKREKDLYNYLAKRAYKENSGFLSDRIEQKAKDTLTLDSVEARFVDMQMKLDIEHEKARIEEKEENAKGLLALGISDEQIIKGINITKERLEEIKQSMLNIGNSDFEENQ